MLRGPFGAPQQKAYFHHKRNNILFKYPAYQDQLGDDDLFSLWAWDSPHGELCHETALLACAIIACNATDGFPSKDQTGLEWLDLKDNPILLPAVYYFRVPSPDRIDGTRRSRNPTRILYAPVSTTGATHTTPTSSPRGCNRGRLQRIHSRRNSSWVPQRCHRRYHHTMTYCADKHTCQMRLLMVGNRLPALSKSMSNAASLVPELQPYAILALPTES
jgi:hypothetical protein